jgi:hypothetical protein
MNDLAFEEIKLSARIEDYLRGLSLFPPLTAR